MINSLRCFKKNNWNLVCCNEGLLCAVWTVQFEYTDIFEKPSSRLDHRTEK